MELKELFNLFSIPDRSIREDQLRCVPEHPKTIFCMNFVSDLLSNSIPLSSSIQINYADHCLYNLTKRIDTNVTIEAIKIVTGWIKNRNASFDAVINSTEACFAYHILTHNDSNDEEFQVAGEFFKMTILLLDMKAAYYEQFLQKILELELLFIHNISLEKPQVITRIFVALAEKVFQRASEYPNEIERRSAEKDRILSILIKCATIKECCELELPFWKKLPTYLKSSKVYQQFIEEMILNFALRCRIIESIEMETNNNTSLMKFRESVSEVMLALTSIIDTKNVLNFFFEAMPLSSANDFEVSLFMIASIASKVELNEDQIVPNIIKYVLEINIDTNASILAAAAKLLAELDQSIAFLNQPYLLKTLTFLVDIIHKRTIAGSVAATALGQICSTAGVKLEPYLDEMLAIFQNLQNYFLHSKAKLKVIKGITRIGCSLTEPKRTSFLKVISDLQFGRVFEAQNAGYDIIHHFDCLTEIFHNMEVKTRHNEVSPLDLILTDYWPHISNLLDAYQSNCEVMTKISEVIEYAVPNMTLSALPLLDLMSKHFVFYFDTTKCPLLLRPLNAVVEKLGNEANCKIGLLTIFEGVTLLVLKALNEDMKFSIVDEYFYLAAVCFKTLSVEMLKSPMIIQVIEMSIELCKIGDKSSNGYVLEFLTSIFTCSDSHPDVKLCVEQAMTLFGYNIIRTLLESTIYVFDKKLITNVANIFDAFKTKSNLGFKELLVAALTTIPNKTVTGIVKAKEKDVKKLIELMTREKQSKVEMINGLHQFRKLINEEN